MNYGDAVIKARDGLQKLGEVTNSEVIQAANCIYTLDVLMRKVDTLWQGDQYGRTGVKGIKDVLKAGIKCLERLP